MNRRTNKNQKLIDDGAVWKNEEGKWCRKCHQCSGIVAYISFDGCQSSYKSKRKCLTCCNRGNYRGTPKKLLGRGIIWIDKSEIWHRKCPMCAKILSYSKIEKCVYAHKRKWLCLSCSKRGAKHPGYGKPKSIETVEKIKKSNIGKHVCSTEYRKRLSEIQLKSGKNHFINNGGTNKFKRKPYILPNGEVVKVQGYEPFTIDLLLSNQVDPSDMKLRLKDKPKITYEWSGSVHTYIPDCYLPKINTVVETKSPWTWDFQKDRNTAKISGSLAAGYDVRVITWEATRYRHTLISDITHRK